MNRSSNQQIAVPTCFSSSLPPSALAFRSVGRRDQAERAVEETTDQFLEVVRSNAQLPEASSNSWRSTCAP